MGIFSKIHRFREAGEAANVHNVERFGEPARSLFTTTKLLSLHHHIDIVDNEGTIVYQARSKAISLHDSTTLYDAAGNWVAKIEKRLMSFHERHDVEMADGTQFGLSTEFFHLIKNITNIEELGWQLRGNVLELNFELYDERDEILAVISQKMISFHDKYCIDIYRPEQEAKIIAILITLQHMIIDRENSRSSDD